MGFLAGAPRIWPTRLDRPFRPNSSAMTRRALSEAMKLTVSTRSSRSTARRRCRKKMAPLAPLAAMVKFCGGWLGTKVLWNSENASRHWDGARKRNRYTPAPQGRHVIARHVSAGWERRGRTSPEWDGTDSPPIRSIGSQWTRSQEKRNPKMASPANLRSRRSAAQLHALAGVEREIRAQDSHNRRKYLRDFNEAYRSYDSVLDSQQIQSTLHSADVVLIGDYHALPAAQRYAASLIEQRALAGDRPVVLGVETIFARDQHILDEWWRREIDESELRQRIRFDLDWGYDWTPFHELLVTARDHAEAVYGLDCMPREDLRKIGARDRHAAAKIAEIRERHSDAVIFALFGESHLAPGHLPGALRDQIPGAKVVTVLQNIDALYWRAAGERVDKVEAVRVNDDVLCVFNATPLEKYESYRLFLDQWSRCDGGPDFAPTIYNLIDSLARFLEINRYSPHNGTQPKFLVDMLPEVYGGMSTRN